MQFRSNSMLSIIFILFYIIYSRKFETLTILKLLSQCLSTSCVKSGFANQKRRVQCLDGVGHVIAPAACDWSKRPVTSQLCRRGACVPVWKESEWSKVGIFLFIQGLHSALFTNKRALMRCLTNRILIFTKKWSLKSKLIM